MITRIAVSDVSVIGRNTQGVRIMALRPEETVVDVAKVSPDDSVAMQEAADEAGELEEE